MSLITILLATLTVLAALAAATRLWFGLTRLRTDLIELGDFEGMHFESTTPE